MPRSFDLKKVLSNADAVSSLKRINQKFPKGVFERFLGCFVRENRSLGLNTYGAGTRHESRHSRFFDEYRLL